MKTLFRYSIGYLILALILCAFYYSKNLLFAISILLIFMAMYEYRKMFKTKDINIHLLLPEIVGIFCCYIFIYEHNLSNHTLIVPALVMGTILSFIITVIRNKKPYFLTTAASICAFLLIFCGLYMIKLTYYFDRNIDSLYLISCFITIVLCSDFFAAKIGEKFTQKDKTVFEISPNKTMLGCITHTITSCIISIILLKLFLKLPFLYCFTAGIIISTFAQFGDFAISLIKRELEIKHSGNLFLKYGGVLDRMDAFIFSAPALYYYFFIISII